MMGKLPWGAWLAVMLALAGCTQPPAPDHLAAGHVMPIADPSSIAGLALWLDPGSLGLSDGASVSIWADETANGNDAAATTGQEPTYDDGVGHYHGQPMVHFDAADSRMSVPTDPTLENGQFTLMAVFQRDDFDAPSNQFVVNKQNTNPQTIGIKTDAAANAFDSVIRTGSSGGTTRENAARAPADQNLHIHLVRYDGATFSYWIDGELVGSTSSSGAVDTSNPGALVLGNHPSVDLSGFGRMGDVAYYDNAISDADLDSLHDWAAAKYPQPFQRAGAVLTSSDRVGLSIAEYDANTWVMVYVDDSTRNVTYATSPKSDPHNWTDSGITILTPGSSGAWDDTGPRGLSLVKDGTTWHLYYDDTGTGQIGVATGSDLESLTKHASNPIFSGTGTSWEQYIRHPSVVLDGTTWHLYYDGREGFATSEFGDIGHATSSDGITWTRDTVNNPVVTRSGGAAAYDADDVGAPEAIEIDGTVYLVFSGFNEDVYSDHFSPRFPHQPGLAAGTWSALTKSNRSPLVPFTVAAGSEAEQAVVDPYLWVADDTVWLYYRAVSWASADRFVYAEAVELTALLPSPPNVERSVAGAGALPASGAVAVPS